MLSKSCFRGAHKGKHHQCRGRSSLPLIASKEAKPGCRLDTNPSYLAASFCTRARMRQNALVLLRGATLQKMNRSFKTLLLWLLISLLPLQSMAVVMSMSCGKAISTAENHHAAAQCHGASAHCPSDDVDAAFSDADGASDSSSAAHHACSACASCCIGASAPPSVALPTAAHAMCESCFAPPGVPGGGFIPAGLERPPKSLFA